MVKYQTGVVSRESFTMEVGKFVDLTIKELFELNNSFANSKFYQRGQVVDTELVH